jgi:hypothetical protein
VRQCRDRGDAEVRHQGATGSCFEQDVVRLHVTVDQALRMSMRQGPGHLAQNARTFCAGQRPTRAYTLGEGLAIHERHHIVDKLARLGDRMDRDDVWMRELGSEACLAQETLAQRRIKHVPVAAV